MIEPEQTSSLSVPVPIEKTAPSVSCCTFLTGFMGVHCAWAQRVEKKLNHSPIKASVKNCSLGLFVILDISKHKMRSAINEERSSPNLRLQALPGTKPQT